MIRIFCIGDPHIKVDNQIRVAKLIDKTLNYIRINKPDLVVIMGDTLDRHKHIHMTPLTVAIKWFEAIREMTNLVVIKGNHDALNNTAYYTDESPFYAIKLWSNTWLADDRIVYLRYVDGKFVEDNEQADFAFLPYSYPGTMMEKIKENQNWKSIRTYFGHQELRGCIIGTKESLIGDEWLEDYPLFISGHIHEYHSVGKNIIYLGTPMNTNFGEKSDKSVSLFTFDKERKENSNYTHQRLYLGIPNKIQYKIPYSEINSLEIKHSDDIVKIIIYGSADEIKLVNKSITVNKWRNLNYKISTEIIRDDKIIISEKTERKGFLDLVREIIVDPVMLEILDQIIKQKDK